MYDQLHLQQLKREDAFSKLRKEIFFVFLFLRTHEERDNFAIEQLQMETLEFVFAVKDIEFEVYVLKKKMLYVNMSICKE